MPPTAHEYLQHILDETRYLGANLPGLDREEFLRNPTLQRAFVRTGSEGGRRPGIGLSKPSRWDRSAGTLGRREPGAWPKGRVRGSARWRVEAGRPPLPLRWVRPRTYPGRGTGANRTIPRPGGRKGRPSGDLRPERPALGGGNPPPRENPSREADHGGGVNPGHSPFSMQFPPAATGLNAAAL
jgi:hypothetical protein